jgi:hypothetical protein
MSGQNSKQKVFSVFSFGYGVLFAVNLAEIRWGNHNALTIAELCDGAAALR